MSKSRLSNIERGARGPHQLTDEKVRFQGLSLSGGKADKACFAVIDYFPKHQKVFLTKLFERIKNEESQSADERLLELISENRTHVKYLGIDVPWKLPTSLRSEEAPNEDHIEWANEELKKLNRKKKPKKIFIPYTQRCVELYLANELEEKFIVNQAMGANSAPLLARAMFLYHRIDVPMVEVNAKVALWRIGRSLDVMKSHLRFHRHSVSGEEARRSILQHLVDEDAVFLYEQDRRLMVENNHAFEAFLCALTAFLKFKKLTEPRIAGFPPTEDWVEIPRVSIPWGNL